jgi:hypothetical protein
MQLAHFKLKLRQHFSCFIEGTPRAGDRKENIFPQTKIDKLIAMTILF